MRNILDKEIYKLFLGVIKYIPITLAVIQTACIVCQYFNISVAILSCIGGTPLIFIGILYAISYIFRYCYLYRMPLYYVTLITGMAILDALIGFPVGTITLYRIYFFIAGIFIITYISYIYKNRNKPNKVDYIKQLCERYCNCK